MKFYGDVLLGDGQLPKTVDEVVEVMRNVPNLVKKQNSGKGVQLEYTLLPLEEVEKIVLGKAHVERLVQKIDEYVIMELSDHLDELLVTKQKFNDLHKQIHANIEFFPNQVLQDFNEMKRSMNSREIKFRNALRETLVQVRSGKKDPSEIYFDELLTIKQDVDGFIHEKMKIKNKLYLMNTMSIKYNVQFLPKSESIDTLMLQSIDNLVLIYYSEKLKEEQRNIYDRHIEYLKDTYENSYSSTSRFYLVDMDLHRTVPADQIRIVRYQNGKLESNWRGLKEYANGDVYDGELKDDKRNGRGKITYEDGDVYDGEWKDDSKNGRGKMTLANGSVYEGDWSGDNKNGSGKMTYADRDVYDGSWKNDYKNGFGKMTYVNGNAYEGDWFGDRKNGSGKMTYADRDVYDGSWKNGHKNGFGKMTYVNGNAYEGDWHCDLRDGRGKLTFANGDVYEGDWEYDKKNGSGKITYANGEVYDGEWEDDEKNGRGKMKYESGGVYEGEWKDDKRHGRGKYTWENGTVYDGQWKDGERNGRGQMRFSYGDVTDGEWKNGVKLNFFQALFN